MEITTESLENGIRCVRLDGRLDLKGTQEIEKEFSAEVAEKKETVLVDMAQVEFIASIGIRMFLSNVKALKSIGQKMILFGLQPLVEEVFKLSGLHAIIPIKANQDEAEKEAKG